MKLGQDSGAVSKSPRLFLPRSRLNWVTLATLGSSLILHAGLLFMPLNHEATPEPKPTQTVKITSISSIKPRSKSTRKVVVAKQRRIAKLNPARRIPRANPVAVAPIKPAVTSAAETVTKAGAETKTGASEPAKSNQFSFTAYPGAEPGCLQLRSCYSTDAGLDQVAAFFDQQLVQDGYERVLELDEKDRKVFRFSKDGKDRYLSIINVEVSTIYAAADAPRTYAELQRAVEIPSEFEELVAQLTASNASAEQLSNPKLFFTQLEPAQMNPDISGEPKLVKDQTPEQLFARVFKPNLPKLSFQVPEGPEGEYGGGPVYRMQQDRSKPFYLNLVPTKDGSGSIVVVWLSLPPM